MYILWREGHVGADLCKGVLTLALDMEAEKDRLLSLFRTTRARTLSLTSTLKGDDFVVQTAFFTSPIKWHIGHVSWMYEAVMGKISKEYGFEEGERAAYLNSYYQQFGAPHDKGRRGEVSRPTTEQILQYYESVSRKVEAFVSGNLVPDAKDDDDRAAHGNKIRLLEMCIHHECQHQELAVYDLQHMLADRYAPPVRRDARRRDEGAFASQDASVRIGGGMYRMGHSGDGYCYDIELPEHDAYLEPYVIDVYPVTNGEFLEFVADGGYETYKWWLADGWEKAKSEGWRAPMYWESEDGMWHIRDLSGARPINPREPVCHVSYYEAHAYCRWAGKRLPTEAEWEMAACWNESGQKKNAYPWGCQGPTPDRCNLLESYSWRCSETGAYPNSASAYGCQQMIGDVWEWTSSEFVGYPGFKSGFDEYNDKWFANQKVLRGGSYGTPVASIRTSYRNFFRLHERWMISGFRCAQDA